MNKQLKVVSRTIFFLFFVLLTAVTVIQVVEAPDLRANPLNQRTTMNAFRVERGPILVQGYEIAQSIPSDDEYLFQRTYPLGPVYAPATGFFSHFQGMTAVESAMNEDLSGIGNTQFLSRIMRIITGEKPQGSAVELTLNQAAQEAAYNALGNYKGAAIALDPRNGKILAMVSTPSYDPNGLSSNDDLEIIENYSNYDQDPDRPLINRTIGGDLYHPGSTYKLLTAAAAIESGDFKSSSKFKNTLEYDLPNSSAKITNYGDILCGDGKNVDLETSIILSCNVPIAELAVEMPLEAVPNMAKAFGFEQDFQIPMQVTPSMAPMPQDKAEAAISAIGQLDVRSTPLQMAMVSAGIANGGAVMKPQLINQVIAPDLKVESSFKPELFNQAISKNTAEKLSDMMVKGVSQPEGAAAMARIDGIEVAGKTGTAENGFDAEGDPLPYTIWFTGFAPAENPTIAVAVVVEEGGGEAHNFEGTSYEIPTYISKQIMEAVLYQ